MIRPRVILGPPGCGKTRRLLSLLDREIKQGTPAGRIAVVTFTRAARLEVQARVADQFGLRPDQLPWVRTIHSACYRLLDLGKGRILDEKRWAEFATRYGYRLSRQGRRAYDPDEDPPLTQRRTPEDLARYVHDWGRNCRLSPEQAMARCPVEGLKSTLYRPFFQRLERFKRAEHLLDFAGMLELVLEQGLRPDVDVAFIDEAQDLSPLQAAVCEMWFEPCERCYVAGDEDQAVYGFQGADPAWLIQLAQRSDPEILQQSHRVPISVHALADLVIRQNKTRVQKIYEPVPRVGSVVHADRQDLVRYIDPEVETFVLARNRIYLRPIARQLLDLGYPYVVEGEGGPSPLSNEKLLRAISVARMLVAADGDLFYAKDLKALLDHVPAGSGLTSWETKVRLRELAKEGAKVAWSELVELGMQALLDSLERKGPLSFLTHWRRYFELLFKRHGCVPKPTIVLTTMHGSKAREADRVIVIPDMSRATWEAYKRLGPASFESENRILYVALTRAKETLVLVSPRSKRHFELPRVDLVGGKV